MEHIAAIMVLVGCMNGQCSEVPAPVGVFETQEECTDMLRPTVSAVSEGYKIFYGKCAALDPAIDYEEASITWKITADDRLDITIDLQNPYMLADLSPKTMADPASTQ